MQFMEIKFGNLAKKSILSIARVLFGILFPCILKLGFTPNHAAAAVFFFFFCFLGGGGMFLDEDRVETSIASQKDPSEKYLRHLEPFHQP